MFNRFLESNLLGRTCSLGGQEEDPHEVVNNSSSYSEKKKNPSSTKQQQHQITPSGSIPKNLQPLPVNNIIPTINQHDRKWTLNSNRLILARNLNDFPVNSQFVLNDEESKRLFAIFRTRKNKIYAIDEKCYHMGGPLEKGDIEDLMVYYDSTKTMKEHPCVICPWHHYYISLKTGESFYLDLDRKYKSKGQRQRTYPLYYHPTTLDLYVELDHRLELNPNSSACECRESEHNLPPLVTLDSDHYVKIHQQQTNQTDSKPHSVVNLKELREKREQQKRISSSLVDNIGKQSKSGNPPPLFQ